MGERIVDFGLNLIYPFAYFGQWNKDKVIYSVGGYKFKVRVGTSDKIAVWEVIKKKVYNASKDFTIRPYDIVVDIGAHIGAFTVYASKFAKKVYSYEALKDNYELLRENVGLNNVTNVETFNVAVSDKKGEEEFYTGGRNIGGSSLYKKNYSNRKLKVPTITLRDIFIQNKLSRINFLKIDTEGAEYKILLNTPPSVLKKIDKVTLEFHDNVDHGHSYKDLVEFFEKNGFDTNVPTSFLIKKFIKIGQLTAIKRPA